MRHRQHVTCARRAAAAGRGRGLEALRPDVDGETRKPAGWGHRGVDGMRQGSLRQRGKTQGGVRRLAALLAGAVMLLAAAAGWTGPGAEASAAAGGEGAGEA